MITVIGEALIDLVVAVDGSVTATPGGAPFNTARACGRLGAEVAFVAALSDDRFGSMLRAGLVADGVRVDDVVTVRSPTTLAVAELDESGAAVYRFHVTDTSAPRLASVGPLPDGGIVFTGGLALVLEPLADAVDEALDSIGATTVAVLDVNERPALVTDRAGHLERVRHRVSRSHLVKVSDEDLQFLVPGVDPSVAARELLDSGPAAVVVTRGGDGAVILTPHGERTVPVEAVEAVEVVDTVGAGDTFVGAVLAWLSINRVPVDRVGDPDVLARAVRAGVVAAGITCTRRGADPPRSDELPADWSS